MKNVSKHKHEQKDEVSDSLEGCSCEQRSLLSNAWTQIDIYFMI